MNQEIFDLLLKISRQVYYEYEGYGGVNNEQRKHDELLNKKLSLLLRYSLISQTDDKEYVITEIGNEVAIHKNWKEYLDFRKEQNEKLLKKEQIDLKISEFQLRTKNLPFVFSLFGIIMSAIAIFISINKDKPNTEQSQQKEVRLDSKQSAAQSILSDERNELNKPDSNTDSLYNSSLDTIKIDTVEKQKTHNKVFRK